MVSGGDVAGDDDKSAVGVDEVDDGHGSDQEDEDFARVAQLVDELLLDRGVVSAEAEQGPDSAGHQQGDGRFVDMGFVLEGDQEISDREEQGHGGDHAVVWGGEGLGSG